MPRIITVGAAQLGPVARDETRSQVVDRMLALMNEASRHGCDLVVFPELALTTFFPRWYLPQQEDVDAFFEREMPGPETGRLFDAARTLGVGFYLGYAELVQEAGRLRRFNTAITVDKSGRIVGKYRKMSIPLTKMKAITGIEKYYFRPGNLGFPVWPTDVGVKVGTVICFDRHFPEGPRCLGLAGCDLMFVPTATAAGGAFWEIELQAHAVANGMWVAGVNRVGEDVGGGPAKFYGRSFFTNPRGEIVAQLGAEKDTILLGAIDTSINVEMREDWGFFRDRRPDAYGALVAP